MKYFLFCAAGICACFSVSTAAIAGKDIYSQVIYECQISEIKGSEDPRKRKLSIKVRNRSQHINIYGFKVATSYLDCKTPNIQYTKQFIDRACIVSTSANLSLGSMAKPPKDDIKVPPGQTRTYHYQFRYPDKPGHKKYRIEHCETHSTATFTAAEAPDVLGLSKKKEQPVGFWEKWMNKVKSWF